MMLDKKQIGTIFLFEFKMGHKAGETIHNSNMYLTQELLMNVHGSSSGSRSFAKEMRALDEKHSGWPLEADNNEYRAVIETDPLNNNRGNCQRPTLYSHLAFEANCKGVKP